MGYKSKRMKFENAIEVHEYHTARYGAPGMKRPEKKEITPEQMKKRNQWNKERICRWKLRRWFDVNDYFSVLTYAKEERPASMEAAKEDFKKFTRIMKREYEKKGYEYRWIRNIEVGTKGAWHVHIIVNRIPDTDIILRKAWIKGAVRNQLLYEKGEFAPLAKYITKTPDTDKRLKETSYSASRNLPLPEPKEHIYEKWETWKKVRIPKGWKLDEESFHEGINPVTGYPYRIYTLLRINRKERRKKE